MQIPGNKIAQYLQKLLAKDLSTFKKSEPLQLITFLIGSSPDQLSYSKMKSHIAKLLKVNYKLIHLKSTPNFIKLANQIKTEASDPKATGVIISQPLPQELSTDSIFDYIPTLKEIEGHKRKTPYHSPIGLAVLTVLKYIYGGKRIDKNLLVNINADKNFFKKIFKNKRVVLIGRGPTAGLPIGKVLSEVKINYININSTTINPQSFYKTADVIISAAGANTITAADIKPGVILINIGVRKEKNKLVGDYKESEIKNIAGFYTSITGGVGPIDVVYIFKNLIEASKLQKS